MKFNYLLLLPIFFPHASKAGLTYQSPCISVKNDSSKDIDLIRVKVKMIDDQGKSLTGSVYIENLKKSEVATIDLLTAKTGGKEKTKKKGGIKKQPAGLLTDNLGIIKSISVQRVKPLEKPENPEKKNQAKGRGSRLLMHGGSSCNVYIIRDNPEQERKKNKKGELVLREFEIEAIEK